MERTRGFLDEALETKSWDEQVAILEVKLLDTVRHAYDNAPAVTALFDGAGIKPQDVKSVEDLAKIPVTRKSELTELQRKNPPFGGLLGYPLDKVKRVFQSPGPIYDPQFEDSSWGWDEALFAAGFRPGDIAINTFSYHMTPAGMMFDDGLARLGAAPVPTGVGEREKQVEIMRDLQVSGFVGMASFLLQIGKKAVEMGLDPRKDLNVQSAFTTAEPLPDSLRESVEEMFGTTSRQGYGTADCGCLAYECYHKGGMHVARHSIFEIVDPTTGAPLPTGETGEVVVTMFKKGYPLIRFGTGDLSALDFGECGCGRKAPKMRGWLGRADQLVKVKGMFVHPGQLQGALKDFEEVLKFRLVVSRKSERDVLTLKTAASGVKEGLAEKISARLRQVISLGVEVEWCQESDLPDDGQVIEDLRKWD